MLALWALFLLAAVVVSWTLEIDAQLTLNGEALRVVEAEAMASSGGEIALHPQVKPGSPVLRGSISRTQSYETRITGEGGRLNLNWILAGENPDRLELLRKFLEIKGVELNDRDRMIDTLLDWVDPDNLVRLNGAETDGDYQPANTFLTRVDDLKRVKGWEDFTAQPGWDENFTVNSGNDPGNAPIDLAWAPRDVLLALPGVTEPMADQFLQLRAGPDGIEGTEDDAQFKRPEDALVALGFSGKQAEQLLPLVTTVDPVVRITSVGRSGKVTRTVQMVVRKAGNIPPQLITWKEL